MDHRVEYVYPDFDMDRKPLPATCQVDAAIAENRFLLKGAGIGKGVMQKASQHLSITDRSIKDIALSMGFEDPYYFSKRFTNVMGMSPSRYRSVTND